MSQIKPSPPRLKREDWLEEALEVISAAGNRALTIELLCERMGVSRGSFYWHFRNREDFQTAIIQYWEAKSTTALRDRMVNLDADPRERLLSLLDWIIGYRYRKFELPLRHWAMRDLATREVLERIDRTRYEEVRSLFEEMGFTGDELEMRIQTCVIFYNFMDGFSIDIGGNLDDATRRNRLRHRMLTSLRTHSDDGDQSDVEVARGR
jgi:AcrR family transcriptional regulator